MDRTLLQSELRLSRRTAIPASHDPDVRVYTLSVPGPTITRLPDGSNVTRPRRLVSAAGTAIPESHAGKSSPVYRITSPAATTLARMDGTSVRPTTSPDMVSVPAASASSLNVASRVEHRRPVERRQPRRNRRVVHLQRVEDGVQLPGRPEQHHARHRRREPCHESLSSHDCPPIRGPDAASRPTRPHRAGRR